LIVGLITSQSIAAGPTDYLLRDWSAAGLRLPSTFRSFLVTLPPAANPVIIGRLSDPDWEGVRNCVKAALADL
jgi:mRNA interferase MazF